MMITLEHSENIFRFLEEKKFKSKKSHLVIIVYDYFDRSTTGLHSIFFCNRILVRGSEIQADHGIQNRIRFKALFQQRKNKGDTYT